MKPSLTKFTALLAVCLFTALALPARAAVFAVVTNATPFTALDGFIATNLIRAGQSSLASVAYSGPAQSGFTVAGLNDGSAAVNSNKTYLSGGFPVTVTFNLNTNNGTGGATNGYDLSSVQCIGGWQDTYFANQNYQVLLSINGGPFYEYGSFVATSTIGGGNNSVMTTVTGDSGLIAHNVTAIQYVFATPAAQGTGGSQMVIHELQAFGSPTPAGAAPAPTAVIITTNGATYNALDGLIVTNLLQTGQSSLGSVVTSHAPNTGWAESGLNDGAGNATAGATAGLTHYPSPGNVGGLPVTITFNLNTNNGTGGATNGYDINSVQCISGWAGGNFADQNFQVLLSTNGGPFYNYGSFVGSCTLNGGTNSLMTTVTNLAGSIAKNVTAIQLVFSKSATGNGGIVIHELQAFGTPSVAAGPAPTIIATQQSGTAANTYDGSIAANLIQNGQGSLAGVYASGSASTALGTLSALNDGSAAANANLTFYSGSDGVAVLPATITYYLNTAGNAGYNITNVQAISGWSDSYFADQKFQLLFSINGGAFQDYGTYSSYNNLNGNGAVSVSTTVGRSAGLLATNVTAVQFVLRNPAGHNNNSGGQYGGTVYRELQVFGSAVGAIVPKPVLVNDTLPSYAETVVGDQVVFTAAYSNSPPASLQWQQMVSGPVTNNINTGVVNVTNSGVITSTLTLSNVQLTNSGTYTLQAVNATNGTAPPTYSTAAQLVVGSVPAAVNNVILEHAGQLGLGAISSVNPSANFQPTWTVNTNNDLVLGSTNGSGPGTFAAGSGSFGLSGCNTNPVVLTDGTDDYFTYASGLGNAQLCGCGPSAGTALTYTLNTSVATNGFDLTNLTVYGGWPDVGRRELKYQALYSTVANPTNFVSLGSFDYACPDTVNLQCAARTMLVPASGALAKNAAAVEIVFSPAPLNGWSGYSEIVVQGTPSPVYPILTYDILPTYAETVVGDSVVFTAAFSNAPAASLQWQYISNGIATDISGATTATLTLSNLQLTNTGSYRLKAVNATNSLAVSYSTAAPLVVSNVPAAVGGMVVENAGQCGYVGNTNGSVANFYTAWTVNTSNNLVYGSADGGPGVSGTVYADPIGNFADGNTYTSGDPAMLADGDPGYITYRPGNGSATDLSLGNAPAGTYVQYTLGGTSTTGYDLTNITVFGGWVDAGRDEQKYEVLYSTIAAPTVFNHLITVDYIPTDTAGAQAATRTTVLPAGAALVPNVYAVKFNFSFVAPPKAGWEGYSEIVVAGVPSAPVPILTQAINPNTAEDVVGGTLTMTANFSSGTPYTLQWMKNGTNAIAGATNSTLTLSNLQLTDTATNGGYSLVASNASGTATTTACAVKVDPTNSAVGNVVSAFAIQTSIQSTFTPTWDTTALSSSLIYNQNPPSGGYDQSTTTNFSNPYLVPGDHAGGLPVLTDGNYGVIVNDGTHPAFADCGNNIQAAGHYVIYKLGAAANGYDMTNLQIASGWNDNGRDSQYYTVRYSTVANPTYFVPLLTVSNNLVGYGANDDTEMRGTFTPAAGVLASNVYALYIDFTTPLGVPNNYSGISEISVFGLPSATNTLPIAVTGTNENTNTPDWLVETSSLIENQLPSSVGAGSFAGGFNGEPVTEGLPALTDGTFGVITISNTNFATCGGAYGAGASVTYTCTNGSWTLTNIVVYSGWGNYNRDGQFYNITYTTLADTNTFLPLTSVTYNPPWPAGVNGAASPAANRVAIAPANGATTLATNVYAVKFDFTPQTAGLDNGYSGYAEIVLQGSEVITVPSLSTNAQLTSLALTPAGTLYPAFATGTTGYTATNTCANNPVAVIVTNADLTATNWLIYNGATNQLASGTNSAALTLSTGVNNVTVQVVSQDLSHTNNYTVAVTLAAPPVVTVNSATIYVGGSATLTATNNASSPGYLWSDSETTASITVSPASTTNYTVTVTDGITGCQGGGSGTVTVLPSTNALLASLTLTPAGTLFPTFATNVYGYNATNTYANKTVTVAAGSADANATLALNLNGGGYGAAVTNNLSISGNTLVLPANTVAVRVVSQDLSQTNVYTVNVLLQPSATVPKLTNSVSGSTLTLTWPADHLGYRLLVQTNNLSKGVSGNISDWGTVSGTATVTSTNITIIKAGVTNVYYKLVYP